MKFFNLLLNGVLTTYCLLLTFSFFAEGKLIFELTAMLLPYWLTLNLGITALFLIFKPEKLKSFSVILLFIVTIGLIFKFSAFTFNFQNKSFVPSVTAINKQKSLKIGFLNKLFSNTNYQSIDEKISSEDFDILGFSEFKLIDKNNIDSLKNYPYYLAKESRDNATIAFFSKYPAEIDTKSPDFRSILPLKLNINEVPYQVFVLHPVPPASDEWVKERDDQLISLANYIQTLPHQNIIILGDFNLTPWSPSYSNFSNLVSFLKNTSQGEGYNFTWHNKFIKTQIDHIFVPNYTKVANFKSEVIDGSDHKLIYTQINL